MRYLFLAPLLSANAYAWEGVISTRERQPDGSTKCTYTNGAIEFVAKGYICPQTAE